MEARFQAWISSAVLVAVILAALSVVCAQMVVGSTHVMVSMTMNGSAPSMGECATLDSACLTHSSTPHLTTFSAAHPFTAANVFGVVLLFVVAFVASWPQVRSRAREVWVKQHLLIRQYLRTIGLFSFLRPLMPAFCTGVIHPKYHD